MTNEPERTVVLFDVMSTLVYDPFYVEMPAFFGMTLDELIACKHPTAWLRFEKGEIDEDEFLRGFFADGRAYDYAGLRECARANYRWIDGMRELTTELRDAGHELHALSNYPTWYRMIEEELGVSETVAWSFVSCRMGVRKPHPESFAIPLRTLGVAPSACLFIDDQERNCEGARAAGMDTIRYENTAALRDRLTERALL